MGQVGFKLALFELKLESSWHVEAILPSSCHLGPSWPRLGGNLEAIWANLSCLGAFLGSKVVSSGGKPWRPRAGPTECAIAVEDEVFEEEESARACKVIQHATATLTTSGGGGFNRFAHSARPHSRKRLKDTDRLAHDGMEIPRRASASSKIPLVMERWTDTAPR